MRYYIYAEGGWSIRPLQHDKRRLFEVWAPSGRIVWGGSRRACLRYLAERGVRVGPQSPIPYPREESHT